MYDGAKVILGTLKVSLTKLAYHQFVPYSFVCMFDNFADTSIGELEDCFKAFVNREDIAIILINQHVSIAV